MDPNIGFDESGVCEKKYRFYFYRARCCPPLPPEWVKVELDFPWPNLSEIKYRFCRRRCPFDGSTTLTLWGKGGDSTCGHTLRAVLLFANTGPDKTNVGVHGNVTAY